MLKTALVARRQGDIQSAIAQYERAISEARKIQDRFGEANGLFELGEIAAEYEGDLAMARTRFRECYEIYSRLGFERGMAYAMMGLGAVAFDENNFQEALDWTEKALSIFAPTSDKHAHAKVLHQLGVIEKRLGFIDSAHQHLKKSLLLFEELKDEYALGAVLTTMGALYIEQLKDYALANDVLNRAVQLYDQLGFPREAQLARDNLSVIDKQENNGA
jgi:tetratricopeptide (TPR) repeat protein